MYWRFFLLIGALVACSFVYVIGPDLGRETRLVFSDGTPVTGVTVRWLDEHDRVGIAEEVGDGTWRIPVDSVVLEVLGESVADCLVTLDAGQASATVSRPAELEIRVEGDALAAAPVRLHVLGSLHGLNQRARQDRELQAVWALDSPDLLLAHASGGFRYRFMGSPDPATVVRSSTPQPHHGGLRWEHGGNETTWMPAVPAQLIAEEHTAGVYRFDELPAGAEVVVLVDPSCGVTLREHGQEGSLDRVHGVTTPMRLAAAPGVAVHLALQAASEIVLEKPPTMDRRSMIVLERRLDASEEGAYPWERIGRLDFADLLDKSSGFSFKRLEAGLYRLCFEEHSEDKWHSWVGEEVWSLGPGETLRVPFATQQRPFGHVPLELRVRKAAAGSSPMLWLSSKAELGENLCFEIDLRDEDGEWVPWISWRGRVQADGRLSPQPWIPEHTEVRVRLSEDYQRRFESHGQWLLRTNDLEQVLGTGSSNPVIWTLSVDPAP